MIESILNHFVIPSLAHRTGKEHCWVSFLLDDRKKICISHSAWIHWLNQQNSDILCESPSLPWKAFSTLENSPFPSENKIISWVQFLRIIPENCDAAKKTHLIWRSIENLRERTSELLAPQDSFGIFRSLILSEKIDFDKIEMLRTLGFVHLYTASGIHLYAIMTVLDYLIRNICLYFKISIQIGIILSYIVSFLLCFYIWILAGARIGMLRPWVILCLQKSALFMGFRWKKGAPLWIALFVDFSWAILLSVKNHQSFSHLFFDSGRWMYALAIGGGLYFKDIFPSLHVGLAIGSWVFTALWEIWHTGRIALATPLLSLITLPLIIHGIYPGVLISILLNELGYHSLAFTLSQTIETIFSGLIKNILYFAMAPWNLWMISPRILIVSIFFSAIVMLIFSQSQKKWMAGFTASFCILGLKCGLEFLKERPKSPFRAQKVEQLDVGQGDAALVSGINAGFIDTGSSKALSDLQWIHLFSQRGIQKMAWVALTHLDEDHSGGLLRLARLIPIGCVVASSEEFLSQRGIVYRRALASLGLHPQDWNSDCIPYPTLAPPAHTLHHGRNENMGAIWIPLNSNGFYLSAGDANAQDEIRIGKWVENLGQDKSFPRILKISHHGSRFSTSPLFLKMIHPTSAWISAGIGNSYGHPSEEVLNQLAQLKIPTHRTDQSGILSSDQEQHYLKK
jgi:competence protein ComEC